MTVASSHPREPCDVRLDICIVAEPMTRFSPRAMARPQEQAAQQHARHEATTQRGRKVMECEI